MNNGKSINFYVFTKFCRRVDLIHRERANLQDSAGIHKVLFFEFMRFVKVAEKFGRPAGKFYRVAKMFCRPAEKFCRVAEMFYRPAEKFCRVAEMFYRPAEKFRRVAEMFCKSNKQ
jgi:hypothetical protein